MKEGVSCTRTVGTPEGGGEAKEEGRGGVSEGAGARGKEEGCVGSPGIRERGVHVRWVSRWKTKEGSRWQVLKCMKSKLQAGIFLLQRVRHGYQQFSFLTMPTLAGID